MTAQTIVDDGESRFAIHEHRMLARDLAYIAETVERATDWSATDLWSRLHRTMGWLQHDLRPHITWEETTLYARIDELAGTPWATRMARAEHRQIEGLIAMLGADSERWLEHRTPRTCAEVVAHLSAIGAVVTGHIEREERLLLPLLESGMSIR